MLHVHLIDRGLADQEARIDRLRSAGDPTDVAEDLLAILQRARDVLRAHLDRQALLGHEKLDTTVLYSQVATRIRRA